MKLLIFKSYTYNDKDLTTSMNELNKNHPVNKLNLIKCELFAWNFFDISVYVWPD